MRLDKEGKCRTAVQPLWAAAERFLGIGKIGCQGCTGLRNYTVMHGKRGTITADVQPK